MKKIVVLFCFLVCLLHHSGIFARTVCGIVVDEQGKALAQARLTFISKPDSVITTVFTDNSGKWCMETDSMREIIVKINYLGYSEKLINIDSLSEEKDNIIQLIPQNYQLEKVIIKEQRKYIEIHDDTLDYNIANYRSGTDRKLEDVLNKMEGVEVTKQGDIKYNSKRIDKLLIEGKDILNDQHKLTLEILDPLKIKKIQIIRNYKSFHEKFLDKFSPKVAMNFLLTDEAKNKINGKWGIGAGYHNKYEGIADLYSVNDSMGYTSAVKSNNTGEQVVSANDFLNMENDLLRAIKKASGNFDNLLPREFQKNENDTKDLSNLLTFNLESGNSAKTSDNISFLATFFDRKGNSKIQRIYQTDKTTLTGSKNHKFTLPYLYLVYDRKITYNKNTIFEIEIPVKYKPDILEENIEGKIDTLTFDNSQSKRNKAFSIFPNIYYSQKLNDNHIIKVETNSLLDIKKENDNIYSRQAIFDTGNTSVYQFSYFKNIDWWLQGLWQYKKGNWKTYTSLSMNVESNSITMKDNLPGNIYYRNFFSQTKNLTPKLKVIYNSNKITFSPEISFPITKISVDNNDFTTAVSNYSFMIKYTLNPVHFLLLKYSLDNSVFDPLLRYQGYTIIDGLTLKKNFLQNDDKIRNSRSFSVRYFHFNLYTGFNIRSIFNYVMQKNSLFTTIESRNNYIVRLIKPSKKGKNIDFQSSIQMKYFHKKLTMNAGIRWRYNENESDAIYAMETKKIDFGIATNFKKNINGTLKYTIASINRQIDRNSVSFVTQKLNAGFKYVYNRLNAGIDAAYNIRKSPEYSTDFTIVNFDLGYEFTPKTSVFIKARDVLNLFPKEIFNTTLSYLYIEMENYMRFPGSIILGIKKKL